VFGYFGNLKPRSLVAKYVPVQVVMMVAAPLVRNCPVVASCRKRSHTLVSRSIPVVIRSFLLSMVRFSRGFVCSDYVRCCSVRQFVKVLIC